MLTVTIKLFYYRPNYVCLCSHVLKNPISVVLRCMDTVSNNIYIFEEKLSLLIIKLQFYRILFFYICLFEIFHIEQVIFTCFFLSHRKRRLGYLQLFEGAKKLAFGHTENQVRRTVRLVQTLVSGSFRQLKFIFCSWLFEINK